ncbi:hypothetical protein MUP59_07025 [Candidatus Bathyarchaeota archaeon]|nr:hypothetical protein [Candidatus Bathyarchaeota archaeon]
MKEISIKLFDSIANKVANESKQRGLTSEELIRYIVGTWLKEEDIRQYGPMAGIFPSLTSGISDAVRDAAKSQMRLQASRGELKCSNCTMPLSAEDVERGTCHLCNGPIGPPGSER